MQACQPPDGTGSPTPIKEAIKEVGRSRLGAEVAELSQLGITTSAETFIAAASPSEDSHRATDEPVVELLAISAGQFVGARGAVVDEITLREAVGALRELTREQSSAGVELVNELMKLWIALEAALSPSEIEELRPAVLNRLPQGDVDIAPARDGGAKLGGR